MFNPERALLPKTREEIPSMIFFRKLLPRCLVTDIQTVDDEWRSLSFFNFPSKVYKEKDVDAFWAQIEDQENEDGTKLFANISKIVINVLSLPHANADCERIFSAINLC